ELGVDHVVALARHAAAHAQPRQEVVPGALGGLEVEHVDVHTRRLQELGLAPDEVAGARLARGRPDTGDHQDADNGVVSRQRDRSALMNTSRAPSAHSPTAGQGSWGSQTSSLVPGGCRPNSSRRPWATVGYVPGQ